MQDYGTIVMKKIIFLIFYDIKKYLSFIPLQSGYNDFCVIFQTEL